MDLTIPQTTIYGIWMRHDNHDGSSKDWAGFLTDRHVISLWGRTDRTKQGTVLSDRPSRVDLQRKIDEKLRKGYEILRETHGSATGWVAPGSAPPPPRPAPPATTRNQTTAALSNWTKECERIWF